VLWFLRRFIWLKSTGAVVSEEIYIMWVGKTRQR
jgi:hypothetical protein